MSSAVAVATDAPAEPVRDRTLIRSVLDGDEASAKALFDRYAARLRGMVDARSPKAFASRFDADDVLQSTFRVFFEGIRSKLYDVPMEADLWCLLSVLAANKLRDKLRHHRASKRSVYLSAADPQIAFDRFPAREPDIAGALERTVGEFLATLPEPVRAVVSLRMTGHAIGEIVLKTGLNLRSVEQMLRTARGRLEWMLAS